MQSTIADLINQHGDALTRAERQLAAAMLDNYPVSGLGTIADLAAKAGVSAPTVVRLVSKIGFKGFAEFQAALRQEVEARISNPIAKHDSWAGAAPQTHILNQFTDAVIGNIRQSLARIDHTSFDDACRMMCDHDAHLFITGGRISGRIADYLFLHMQVIRPGVSRIEASSNAWPHDLLDLKQGDVLAVFDIRRYENTTLRMAEMAKGARRAHHPVHRPVAIARCTHRRPHIRAAHRSAVRLGFDSRHHAAGGNHDLRRGDANLGYDPRPHGSAGGDVRPHRVLPQVQVARPASRPSRLRPSSLAASLLQRVWWPACDLPVPPGSARAWQHRGADKVSRCRLPSTHPTAPGRCRRAR
jgi:DNA-binding MurR/RpiR family transcriptional regulator